MFLKRRVLHIEVNKGLYIDIYISFPCNKTNTGHQIKSTMRYHVLSLFHFLKLIKRYLTTERSKTRFFYPLFYVHTTEWH